MKRRDFLRYGAIGLGAAALPSTINGGTRAGVDDIVRFAIHPAIGVARVGNSPDQFFFGPEVAGPHPTPEGGFKDAAGRMKRQAARFRIYGLDANGTPVREITADEAEITWTVHLANKKSEWYDFEEAFDIPETQGLPAAPGRPAAAPLATPRRNAGVTGDDRTMLVNDPGPRSIAGVGVNSTGGDARYAAEGSGVFGIPVPLGELRTDDAGRLLVLGGRGASGPATPGRMATTFANNDGWYDDISDGPVEATVRIGDRVFSVEGAWVVVGPPNYAPGIQSIVTMYDVIFEVATRLEPERAPRRPSFTRQIYPLFARHVEGQWVNAGFLQEFGWGAPGSFLEPSTLARLADRSEANRALRTSLFRRFRDPAFVRLEPDALPPYYGDAIAFPPVSPRNWTAVLPIQYRWLEQWAAGDFDADWPAGGLRFAERLEDLPIEEQPAALDRAVLDECLGGAFHPGCEMTWPMRVTSLYAAPFRLRRRLAPEPDWGERMTSAIALAPDGPLSASGAGDLSRWMAVPWQTDTSSCLSAYDPSQGEYLPTFWPARVPNDVLTMQSYRAVLDRAAGASTREAAFRQRIKWLREMPQGGSQARALINRFVAEWYHYGIIARQPGPGDAAFPEEFWVEVGYGRGA